MTTESSDQSTYRVWPDGTVQATEVSTQGVR